MPEEKVKRFGIPILFGEARIIGVKNSERSFNDLGLEEFVRGIITGNINMVKSAVGKNNIDVRLPVPLICENMNEIRLDPINEAHIRGNTEIGGYLNKIIEAKNKESEEFAQKSRKQFAENCKAEFKKWISDATGYIRFSEPVEWASELGDEPILGVCKTNFKGIVEDWYWGSPDNSSIKLKTLEIAKNEEVLIRGIFTNNASMVKQALESKLIDRELSMNVVTDNKMCCKMRCFEVIPEAIKASNQEIISLLREYQSKY